MPAEFWKITPNHSNLVETAHVATNRNTNIRLTPLEALEKYVSINYYYSIQLDDPPCIYYRARELDARVAASVLAASKTCIPRNINNSEKARMSRNMGRQSHRAAQSTAHLQLHTDIIQIKNQLADSAQNRKELKAKLKDLTEKKKEVGKSPRNIEAPSNRFKIVIPEIVGTPASPTVVLTDAATPPASTTIEAQLDLSHDVGKLPFEADCSVS